MAVENSNSELLPNKNWDAKIMSEDQEMAKYSVHKQSRSKRGVFAALGAFMLLKDTYEYVMGIANPSKSQEEYFEEVLDGIKQNHEAINRNYNAIQKVEQKVDRNFYVLNMVSDMARNTLAAVKKTRLDILNKLRTSEIKHAIVHLNLKIEYFNIEMEKVKSLPEEEHVRKLLANKDLLKDLRDTRIPNKDSLHTYLHNIIFQGHCIPESVSDKEAFSALDALYYGTYTYVSVMFFLLEQYSFISDYYYRSDDIDKFNEYFEYIVNTFDDFKHSLVIPSGSSKESLMNNVINILITVNNKYTNAREISSELSKRIESLSSIKQNLEEMELPVIREDPEKILGNLKFVQPEIRTPIGEWKKGAKVSYAIQYRNKGIYSKVGKWSKPFTVKDKANPILTIPTDRKNGNSRVIFRKFNNDNFQLVGVLEDQRATKFRDIDRDLYNVALDYDHDTAIEEVNTYLQNGANINAEFDNGRRAIHAAAQSENTQIVENFFINNDLTDMLNVKDNDGFTPMHIAAAAGHDDFIELLIDSGVDINERTYSDEFTPLHIAAYKGFETTVEVLMRSNKTDYNAQDKNGFTPLHSAVFAGLHVVEVLMSNENVDINAKSNTGLTALHISIIENFPDITETLIKSNRIDVNVRALGNFTALHFALIFGHTETIKLLTGKNEIEVNAQANNNWTALHFAISLQSTKVVSQLLKINSINVNIPGDGNITALHLAATIGHNDIIPNLLEKKADIEAKTSYGLTALHLAAKQGKHETVSMLVDKGAFIEAKTFSGLTPLLLAASSKNSTAEVLNVLLERGANTKAVADNGESYPWIVLKTGNSDVVNFIMSEDKKYYLKDESGNDFLHYAAEGGNLDVVKYFIERKGNFVNIKNFNKVTPLHLATKSGNLDLVKYLIETQRASIDARNTNKETPLYFAAKNGHSGIAMYLIEEQSAYVDEKLVLLAAKGGSLDLVIYLINKKNLNVDVRNKNKETVLHLAASSGNLQLVKYLIEKQNVNVFTKNDYGQYPLNFGTQSGNLELVKYLAEKTLGRVKYHRIDVKDKYGKTPLYYAIRNNNLDLIKYLVSLGAANQSDKIPLHSAVESANVDIVKYLLSIGANINSKGYKNRTSLHIALMRNDSDIVHCLLDKEEIDVTVKDAFNITPLHLAAQGSKDLVKYLLKKGADVNAKRHGELCSTPLCFAIKVGDFEMVKYLIKEGANINDAVNPEFVSVDLSNHNINNLDTLHFAVSLNNSNVVKYLVQEGAEPNKPPWNGYLLLATSAMRSNFDLVQYFVQKGSDFRGHSDKYPLLHAAAKAGNLDMVKYLIDKGLNISVKDSYGKTTLYSAAGSGNVNLVKYLIEVENMDPNDKDELSHTPLKSAIENGKLETAKYLMEKTELSKTVTFYVKHVSLGSSVLSGNLNLVKYLIDLGADVNAKTFMTGNAPLHEAAKDFHVNIVKYLVKNNADIRIKNSYHQTPAEMALLRKPTTSYTSLMQLLTVRYLVEQGSTEIYPKKVTYDMTGYSKGVKMFLSEYSKYLLARNIIRSTGLINGRFFSGIDLGYKDKNGLTLLHLAAETGRLEAAKFLVNNGANLYAQDNRNKTPSNIAIDNDKNELARYLENVKHTTENHYHKRDITQKLKNDDSEYNRYNIAKGLSTLSGSNIIGYTKSYVASGASKPFSLISLFITILSNSVKSVPSLNYFFKPTTSAEYCKAPTAVTAEDINTNSTLFLLDVIIKKTTGQKYFYTSDISMSLPEANGYALDIVNLFDGAIRQAAFYSKISPHRLNIDFVEVQKDCIGKILGNKYNEIPDILKLHMERACPDRAAGCSGKLGMKTFDKFTDEFNKVIHIRMSQWMQNKLQNKILTPEAMKVKG